MADSFVSSLQIQKLGHNIQEIRERALFNIITKLDQSSIDQKDIGRIKDVLQKLFKWFQLEPLFCEDTVLNLIKRIFESDHGPCLIKFYEPKTITTELIAIGKVVHNRFHYLLDDIMDIINARTNINMPVPMLKSELPLSYRTGDGDNIGTTATSIRGVVLEESSPQLQYGNEDIELELSSANREVTTCNLKFLTVNWQHLITPDCHVLESVEDSLRNPTQPTVLIHSCEFFNEVLLQDFPAEVFIQRPAIVLLFQHLLSTCRSSRIATATLHCLYRLTKSLKSRIYFYSDPNTHNLKENRSSGISSNLSSPISGDHSNSTINYYNEDTTFLQSKQITIPHYCLNTISCVLNYLHVKPISVSENNRPIRKKCQNGINTSLNLLNELITILKLCFLNDIWYEENNNSSNSEILQLFGDCLIKYGDMLEHIRLDFLSNFNQSKRSIYLHLIHNITYLLDILPTDRLDKVLPKCLKTALSKCILDASLSRLYPKLHQTILEIVKNFTGKYQEDSCGKYNEINNIFRSMSSAIKFLENSKHISLIEAIKLASDGIASLEFHKIPEFISVLLDLCSTKLSLNCYEEEFFESIDKVILPLLSHANTEIRVESYRKCREIVVNSIGTKFSSSSNIESGSQILFILRPEVLKEIILYGLSSNNESIENYSDDIILHILKCKILVSSDIWYKIIEVLIPNFPILLCYTGAQNSLSRTLVSIFDPDKAESLHIPSDEVFKGNCCLLYSDSATVRNEAISRLCWLLSLEENSGDLLPKINNLHDKSLSLVCQLKRLTDLNCAKSTQHFYQPSSLHQVLSLLSPTTHIEPVIRRSALTQVSVMMEDPVLHATFLERDGLTAMRAVMLAALSESDYSEYPDSVVPTLAVLRQVGAAARGAVREDLARDGVVLRCIVRGLFLFCTEERAKQDGSILLFTLLFNNFISGSPQKHNFSLPEVITRKLNVPFICKTHLKVSVNTLPILSDNLISDKWCLSALQIHWNSEWFGGFKELLNWKKVCYNQNETPFDESLKMTDEDLESIKYTSLDFCINANLKEVRNGNSHLNVTEAVHLLANYIQLYTLTKDDYRTTQSNIILFEWEQSLSRFLNTPPASNDDTALLITIINFLSQLVPLYNQTDEICWITKILKTQAHGLSDFFQLDSDDNLDSSKQLTQTVLKLITVCVNNEQSFLKLFSSDSVSKCHVIGSDWNCLVLQMIEHLKFNDSQHFYNLAYLDSLLSCLVHLTVTLGWSNCLKSPALTKTNLTKLVSSLCELVGAFHCGKGPSAALSLMGLSITRNVLITLNHVLVEVQHYHLKDWEELFLGDDVNGENTIRSFCALLLTRDVILRTAVIQLFSGFAVSLTLSLKLIKAIEQNNSNIWETFVAVILDHEEASIVRENSATLLNNILHHAIENEEKFELLQKLLPRNGKMHNPIQSLINFLLENNFFKELDIIIACLYTEKEFYYNFSNSEVKIKETSNLLPSSLISSKKEEYIFAYTKNIPISVRSLSSRESSSNYDGQPVLTTAGFIKALSSCVNNLIILAPLEISDILQETGVVKALFRCVIIPSNDLKNTKDLANYCEHLYMNQSIVSMISTAVNKSTICSNTILNTRDCLNQTITLLNTGLFCTELSPLINVRNDLWRAIYLLLGNLITSNNLKHFDSVNIILSIIEECGYEHFVETLCESISSNNWPNLQYSALTALISLLHIVTLLENTPSLTLNSILNLFDNTSTPRSSIKSDTPSKIHENINLNVNFEKTQLSILENAYFNNINAKFHSKPGKSCEKPTKSLNIYDNLETSAKLTNLKSGAELCKILLKLHEITTIKPQSDSLRLRHAVLTALTSLLSISHTAKSYARDANLITSLVKQLRELCVKLNLHSVDVLRRAAGKRNLSPLFRQLTALVGLVTNFMLGECSVKEQATEAGLPDVVFKLWPWFVTQRELLGDVLRMLCTFTTSCIPACQSLPLTSALPGFGLRKQSTNNCLLNAVTIQIGKEMDLISRTHDLTTMQLCFHILHNSCEVVECRQILVKSNILQFLTRLHPAMTKRQKPYETVEFIWLEFLQTFTNSAEGQSSVAKIPEALELIMTLTGSTKVDNRLNALMILRNIAFYQSNRPRLLTSEEFLNILDVKLTSGSFDEKYIIVTILWSLAANNQKGKLVLKCAQLDLKLQETIKLLELSEGVNLCKEKIKQMYFVLNLLRDGEKIR